MIENTLLVNTESGKKRLHIFSPNDEFDIIPQTEQALYKAALALYNIGSKDSCFNHDFSLYGIRKTSVKFKDVGFDVSNKKLLSLLAILEERGWITMYQDLSNNTFYFLSELGRSIVTNNA